MDASAPIAAELVDVEEFFAPAPFDLFNTLMSQYSAARKRLENMAAAVSADACAGVLHYFVDGNVKEQRYTLPRTIEELFGLAPAIAQLDADFWGRALRLTDVLDCMPQKRRDDWFNQIQNPMGKKGRNTGEADIEPIPAFTEETVRATLETLLTMRTQFFSERVDGIFQRLSRKHVTNSPQGFRERMIISRALTSYGTVEYSTSGVIGDLRCVIAKFMGRDEPKYGATDALIKIARKNNGQWMSVDGGALRIRIYNGVGTAHLEVHPDMAWRLNAVLANLHPQAIPAEFRERPKREKKSREHKLFNKPLPFAVVDLLATMKPGYRRAAEPARDGRRDFVDIPRTRRFDFGDHPAAALAQAEQVLQAIGGVLVREGNVQHWAFDYEPEDVLDEIVCSGCIPDQKSHQFYPTPASIAERAVQMARIEPSHRVLEPSAGQGAIAGLVPGVECVEVSALHCQILRAKGHVVHEADFMQWSGGHFDRVVMNPPFSEGRWQAHVARAASMADRVVAVVPASAYGKELVPGYRHEWSEVFANEFDHTGISVVIVALERNP